LGKKIDESKNIDQLIDQLTDQVISLSQQISTVKESQSNFSESFKKTSEKVNQLRGRPLFYPYIGTGIGRGPYVELEDGSVKLDLINGIGIHIMGHSHPRVIKASLRGALKDVLMQGHLQANGEYIDFSNTIVSLAAKSSKLKYCWISTCGTMANENALKISRQKNTPARMVLALNNAFAGRSTMMAELTDNPAYKQGLPDYNEVLRVPFYDAKNPARSSEESLRIVKEHVAKNEGNISVFCFEPMQGEGGYNWAPREFFIPIFEFLKEKKIAIWADEVQTFMRTGEMFAFETLKMGSYIDICTIAKTAQCAATLYTEEYNPKPGLIAGTFASSTPSLSAGIEIMKMISQEGFLGPNGKISRIHKSFVSMLNELNETTCKGLLKDAGGLGLMIAVTPLDGTKEKVDKLLQTLFKNGLMSFGCGKNPFRIRFLVPAVMEEEDIKVAKKIIEKSILECAK
jgi:acetylornithine/N-succinyldiaminopimelate aminotransferase